MTQTKQTRDLAEYHICNDAIEAYGDVINTNGYFTELVIRRAQLAHRLGIVL